MQTNIDTKIEKKNNKNSKVQETTITNLQLDVNFIKQLQKSSGASLKQCMQCGVCTAVCELSPVEKPFPRKEMIWASWGLKDKLIGNPDVWLCHQCGDCSASCPRSVNPADVLASVRNMSYQHYARPKFLGKLLSKPIFLPLVLLIPIIFISAIIYFAGTTQIPVGNIDYSEFFPHAYLNSSVSILFLIVLIGIFFSIKSFWNDMKKNMPIPDKKNSIIKSVIATFKEVLLHTKFKTCSENKHRYYAHQLIFWGFVSLFVVTFFAIIFVILNKYPLDLWNPVKIIGNLASIALFIGIGILMFKRLFNKKTTEKNNYYDSFFILTIFFLTLSGVGVEMGRFLNWSFAYHIYFVHLVFVWLTIIYLPYTKFAHIIYRTVALVYTKHIGRE